MQCSPPFPAPYLQTVGQLPNELAVALRRKPSTAQKRQAAAGIAALKKDLRQARQTWEREARILIIPERPFGVA